MTQHKPRIATLHVLRAIHIKHYAQKRNARHGGTTLQTAPYTKQTTSSTRYNINVVQFRYNQLTTSTSKRDNVWDTKRCITKRTTLHENLQCTTTRNAPQNVRHDKT